VVFYGLVVGSVAPLALLSLFIPNGIVGIGRSSLLTVIAGVVVAGVPVLIWRRYAAQIASSGGLYSFVERSAGTKIARLHGLVWVVSYFLYLPSTVAQVFYGMLPATFPGMRSYRPILEVGIPVLMVVGLVMWRTALLSLTAVAALLCLLLAGVLAVVATSHTGAATSDLALDVPATTFSRTAGSVSLLFVCSSLPLYFGGELRKPKRHTSRGLPIAYAAGGVACLAAALSFDRLPISFLKGVVPGSQLATVFSGASLARLVALGTAVSLLTLVLLEFVALTRLLAAMFPLRPRAAELLVGGVFIASSAATLASPEAAYEQLLRPSLVALYLSLLIVFLVYPRFRRSMGPVRRGSGLAPAAVASLLMLYGLLSAVAPSALS
jgi:amino acid transporter